MWSLNIPRLEEINAYADQVARERGVEMLDFWYPTLQREMDPLQARDMRHYGQATTHELVQLVLRATCSAPRGAAAAEAETKFRPGQWPGYRPPQAGRACETPFFSRCNTTKHPGFVGFSCLDNPVRLASQAACLGDPKELNTCAKLVQYANQPRAKREQNVFNSKPHNQQLARAAGSCACPPEAVGEVYKKVLDQNM